jgi:predicted ATP-grasp superfamily ATP-dependent carboligase
LHKGFQTLKLLVFEYICGGGLAGQALSESLLAEGRLMLQALLDDLKLLPEIQVLLPLDVRCTDLNLPENVQPFVVATAEDQREVLHTLISQSDALWPIAPETDGILVGLAKQALELDKTVLLSDPEIVSLCSDKLATYQCLKLHAIPVVQSLGLLDLNVLPFTPAVIKPRDGVGCEGGFVISDQAQFQSISQSINVANYLLQPLMIGDAVSLSCLFKNGQAWLLTTNQQQVVIKNNRFNLQACEVNTHNSQREFYLDLIKRVAMAMPGLWGYIGIDLIETAEFGSLILEINPRLTTSYVGIRSATGINVAEQVLRLLDDEPDFSVVNSQSARITIH